MSNTQIISELVDSIKYEQLPDEVIEQVKKITLHVIAVSLAAEPIPQAKTVKQLVQNKKGKKLATVWGGKGEKVELESAVFANATLADILDWEDCSWSGHPSAGAVSVAFALAESYGLSGKDYITSIAAAYEGYQRIACSVKPTPEYRTQYGSGLISWQTFVSTFVAAKILKLNVDEINQAIGATLYQTPIGISRHAGHNKKSDIYHYAHGTDARNALFAVELTKAGFDNGMDYLDGPQGYWHFVSNQQDEDWYTKPLGRPWYINETYIKHWPANMWVQTPLEILSHIYAEHPFTADEVEQILVSPDIDRIVGDYSKTTRTTLDAQFNTGFCLASFILDQNPGPQWFLEDKLVDSKVIELASKVSGFGEKITTGNCFAIFATGSFPEVTVKVILRDGTILSKTENYPKGHPRNDTTLEEEEGFFRKVTHNYLSEDKIEKFITLVEHMESVEDFSQLADCVW